MNPKSLLLKIIKASGWTQEQLAQRLGVSFATLNSWINERSQPRQKALKNIEKLYLDIVGADTIDEDHLEKIKGRVLKLVLNPLDLVENRKLLDKLTLFLTYHTNTIEGSTMTLSDVEEVIFDNKVLANRTAIEQAEARNHQATLHWLIDKIVAEEKRFIIDKDLILGIHLRLMNGIISNAGQYRNHPVRIMSSSVVLANWIKIPKLIEEIIIDINSTSGDLIKDLAKTHAEFEKIHPFSDGNGRTGRLILLAQALKHKLIPPLVIKERKHAYYKYLELAQTEEKYDSLEMFIAESVEFTKELLFS